MRMANPTESDARNNRQASGAEISGFRCQNDMGLVPKFPTI